MAVARSQPTLGDYLVREGIISQSQFNNALDEQRRTAKSIGRILVDQGLITENLRINILHKRFGFELVRLNADDILPDVLSYIPYAFAEKHRAIPVRLEDDKTLIVAMEDPSDLMIVDAIKNQVGLKVKPVVVSEMDIEAVLPKYQSSVPEKKTSSAGQSAAAPDSLARKILRHTFFPILAIGPLILVIIMFFANAFGWQELVRKMLEEKVISNFDIGLYTALAWGIWAIVIFEINGFLFGQKKDADDYGL